MAAILSPARSGRQTQAPHREQRAKASSKSSQLIDRKTEDSQSTREVPPSCVGRHAQRAIECPISVPQIFMRLVLGLSTLLHRRGRAPHYGDAQARAPTPALYGPATTNT